MSEKKYCPICGRRIAILLNSQTRQTGWGEITTNFYLSNSTEPVCFGHNGAPLTVSGRREAVPKAFYDAFSEKELQP